VDTEIVAVDLVDVAPDTCQLVAQALAKGPGIEELAGLVNLVEDAIQKAKGAGRFLPTIEVNMVEGAFGAGPGDDMRWDNRFDLGVHVRWNLTDLFTSSDRLRVADAQRQQAHLAYQDLRAKLTAGVQESRAAILYGQEELKYGEDQLKHAKQARDLSKKRIDNMLPGATADMMLSLQSLAQAQLNRLNAIREYDKAQLRLMLLVGCRSK
jgi:outer membrane protein TolC